MSAVTVKSRPANCIVEVGNDSSIILISNRSSGRYHPSRAVLPG